MRELFFSWFTSNRFSCSSNSGCPLSLQSSKKPDPTSFASFASKSVAVALFERNPLLVPKDTNKTPPPVSGFASTELGMFNDTHQKGSTIQAYSWAKCFFGVRVDFPGRRSCTFLLGAGVRERGSVADHSATRRKIAGRCAMDFFCLPCIMFDSQPDQQILTGCICWGWLSFCPPSNTRGRHSASPSEDSDQRGRADVSRRVGKGAAFHLS